MTRLLLITLLVLSSGPAYAEWVSIGTTDKVILYIDLDTIRRKGDRVRLWHLHDFKTVETVNGDSILSIKMQSEIECLEERIRMLAGHSFSSNMGGGEVVYSDTDEKKWEPIVPDSSNQALWKVVCVLKILK